MSGTRAVAAAICVISAIAASAGCSAGSPTPGSARPFPGTDSPNGITQSVHTDAYDLTVTTGIDAAPAGTQLVATANPASSQGVPDFISSPDPRVDLVLGDHVQPQVPVSLSFSFAGHDHPVPSASLVPVVIAFADGSTEPEVLGSSQWHPDTQTLTAQTTHLSTYLPAWLDVTKFGNRLTGAINGYLQLSKPRPACAYQPLTIGPMTYSIDPETNPVAWPCLDSDGSTIGVSLHSNSPNGWLVQSTPHTNLMTVDNDPDVTAMFDRGAYQTIFAPLLGNGTFLVPGGTTTLRFDKSAPPEQIKLHADANITLANTVLFGLKAMFPDSKLLEIPDVNTCLTKLVGAADYTDDSTGAGFGDFTQGLITCVHEATANLAAKPADVGSIAGKTLGAVLSLLPDGATLLAADVRGAIGGLVGANTVTIDIHTRQQIPSAAAAQGAGATVNLKTEITSNSVNHGKTLGPNHYQLSKPDNVKGPPDADVNYEWTINRPDGSDLGYCKGHVTVTDSPGQVVARYDDSGFNACEGGGTYGTNTVITAAGTYTLTLDIEMERGPTLHTTQQFVVDQ